MTFRLLLFALLSVPSLHAGLWDRDRPTELPEPYAVTTGRFDDYPPAYYESRLGRASAVISALDGLEGTLGDAQADRIVAAMPGFDDAAVAHFRAGRYAEAIIVLDRKSHLMTLIRQQRAATVRAHRGSALANKAACLHHRWMHESSPDAGDLRLGSELLSELLVEDRYNSDARWSLLEINWLIDAPRFTPGEDPLFPNMLGLGDSAFRGTLDETALVQAGIGGCLQWLARRIIYEGGWRDVDVMYAYSLALCLAGHAEESLFAWFRVCDLIDGGARTGVRNSPAPGPLKRVLGVHLETVPDQDEARTVYNELRAEADAWRASRTSYLTEQLQLGRHPDAQPDFWSGWRPDEPAPVADSDPASAGVSPALLIGGFGGLLVLLVLILGATLRISRKGSAPHVDEL